MASPLHLNAPLSAMNSQSTPLSVQGGAYVSTSAGPPSADATGPPKYTGSSFVSSTAGNGTSSAAAAHSGWNSPFSLPTLGGMPFFVNGPTTPTHSYGATAGVLANAYGSSSGIQPPSAQNTAAPSAVNSAGHAPTAANSTNRAVLPYFLHLQQNQQLASNSCSTVASTYPLQSGHHHHHHHPLYYNNPVASYSHDNPPKNNPGSPSFLQQQPLVSPPSVFHPQTAREDDIRMTPGDEQKEDPLQPSGIYSHQRLHTNPSLNLNLNTNLQNNHAASAGVFHAPLSAESHNWMHSLTSQAVSSATSLHGPTSAPANLHHSNSTVASSSNQSFPTAPSLVPNSSQSSHSLKLSASTEDRRAFFAAPVDELPVLWTASSVVQRSTTEKLDMIYASLDLPVVTVPSGDFETASSADRSRLFEQVDQSIRLLRSRLRWRQLAVEKLERGMHQDQQQLDQCEKVLAQLHVAEPLPDQETSCRPDSAPFRSADGYPRPEEELLDVSKGEADAASPDMKEEPPSSGVPVTPPTTAFKKQEQADPAASLKPSASSTLDEAVADDPDSPEEPISSPLEETAAASSENAPGSAPTVPAASTTNKPVLTFAKLFSQTASSSNVEYKALPTHSAPPKAASDVSKNAETLSEVNNNGSSLSLSLQATRRHHEDQICRKWNRGECFKGSSCSYFHECLKCGGGHPRVQCPQFGDSTTTTSHPAATDAASLDEAAAAAADPTSALAPEPCMKWNYRDCTWAEKCFRRHECLHCHGSHRIVDCPQHPPAQDDASQQQQQNGDEDAEEEICLNWNHGRCRMGDKCKRVHACSQCNSHRHPVTQCDQPEWSTGEGSHTAKSTGDGSPFGTDEVCLNWNNGRCKLTRAQCRRLHVCSVCGEAQHAAIACTVPELTPQDLVEAGVEICLNWNNGRCADTVVSKSGVGNGCKRVHICSVCKQSSHPALKCDWDTTQAQQEPGRTSAPSAAVVTSTGLPSSFAASTSSGATMNATAEICMNWNHNRCRLGSERCKRIHACWICRHREHTALSCPQAEQHHQHQQETVCLNWNQSRCRLGKKCKRSHVCSICHGEGHTSKECANA